MLAIRRLADSLGHLSSAVSEHYGERYKLESFSRRCVSWAAEIGLLTTVDFVITNLVASVTQASTNSFHNNCTGTIVGTFATGYRWVGAQCVARSKWVLPDLRRLSSWNINETDKELVLVHADERCANNASC